MNEQPFELQSIKRIWHTERFVEELEEAIRTHPCPYDQLPEVIELNGVIANSADKLLKDTLRDPEKKERGMYGKIGIDGKFVMSDRIDVGSGSNVVVKTNLGSERLGANEKRYERTEYLAFTMHTHGTQDVPASFTDMTSLIKDFANGEQAGFVLTPTTRMIFLRSLETPELEPDHAKTLTSEKANEFKDDVISHIRINNVESDIVAQTKKNMQKIIDFCREYKIAIYNSLEGHRYTRLNIE